MTDDGTTPKPAPPTWPDWPVWTWCAARSRRRAARRGSRARTSAAAAARRAVAAWPAPADRRWSGPGPDSRDPQLLGSATRDTARSRGWSGRVAEGSVFGRWSGGGRGADRCARHADVAERRGADSIRRIDGLGHAAADGAGATVSQDRARRSGTGVVNSLRIVGPVAPSWRKGRYHIAGRGPRDTYG